MVFCILKFLNNIYNKFVNLPLNLLARNMRIHIIKRKIEQRFVSRLIHQLMQRRDDKVISCEAINITGKSYTITIKT